VLFITFSAEEGTFENIIFHGIWKSYPVLSMPAPENRMVNGGYLSNLAYYNFVA
jgi:hypothetical protein